MEGRLDSDACRDADEGAVAHECGVEGREAVVHEGRMPRQVLLHAGRVGRNGLLEAAGLHFSHSRG